MPRTADPTAIPERLLAAGLDLFLSQGYNGTGIQQITDQAGVPKGSFYNHFSSKEVFGARIVDLYSEHSASAWKRWMRGAPSEPMAAIRHVFGAMTDYHERAGCSSGCLIGNLAAEMAPASKLCRKRLLAAQLAWRERLSALIRTAQEAGEIRGDLDPTALSALTWSVWEGALLRMKVEGSVRPLRENIAMLLDYVYVPTDRPAPPAARTIQRSSRNAHCP
jgi:TetR/AcrR family transcriptional repressor of nem operon